MSRLGKCHGLVKTRRLMRCRSSNGEGGISATSGTVGWERSRKDKKEFISLALLLACCRTASAARLSYRATYVPYADTEV